VSVNYDYSKLVFCIHYWRRGHPRTHTVPSVDIGDTKDKRSLRLSSIKPVMKNVDDDEAVVLTKEEHVSLLEEISHLSDSLQQLQLKVEKIGK